MNAPEESAESIFLLARDIAGAEERRRFLEEACDGRDGLLKAVEELLEADVTSESFFNRVSLKVEGPGTTIGRYKLLEQIGEGGFGVVYMADQQEPVRRKVALKIIKAGMDTRQVIARFEAERQALALMDHPHIAKVLDAGATDTGRPYFVMELVQGVRITQFCEENQLTVRERIELFIPVCDAIQHAHQKGVIHRDIKPSNVLVTRNAPTSGGHAMVIDFGVAKAIDQRLTEKTLFTNFARMIGTPAYMSPEQAEMSRQDVDTRSDVYSLGILLYELLTGTTPFPEERLKEVGYAELQRIIAEEEPVRPSTVLSRMNGRSRKVARDRRCEPAALMRLIRGDLDWIVLKAIEKDRERRYETANGLGMDLRRYLANEPVIARPPSTVYKMRKFVRRNRTVAVATLTVLVALLAGVITTSWQAAEARREKANAEAALKFVRDDLLSQADPLLSGPDRPPNRNLTLLTAVQQAAQGIEERYHDQPLVLAEIQLTLGKAFRSLGELDSANRYLQAGLPVFRTELGPNDLKTFEAGLEIAQLLHDQSKYAECISLCHELLKEAQDILGPDHELTLETMLCLGWASFRSGDLDQALEMFQQVYDTASLAAPANYQLIVNGLFGQAGVALYQDGYTAKSTALIAEAYRIAEEHLGQDHPTTLRVANEVGNHLMNGDNAFHQAEAVDTEALERARRTLGDQHAITVRLMSELAELTRTKGLQHIPRQREVFELAKQAFGPDNRNSLIEEMRLGWGLGAWGHFEEAEVSLQDAVERLLVVSGEDATFTRWAMLWLAEIYGRQGRFQEAEAWQRRVVDATGRALHPDSKRLYRQRRILGSLYARQANWEEAAQVYRAVPTHSMSQAEDFSAGLILARLADNREALNETASLALERFGNSQNPKVAHEIAFGLLLVFDALPASERAQVFQFADCASKAFGDPTRRVLLGAMAASRRNEWARAADQLAPLVGDSDAATAILAGCLLAQAHHALGQTELAHQNLLNASDRLERALRCGDMGHPDRFRAADWPPYAACIMARDQCDLRLHGRATLPSIDTEMLAAAREQWKPVRELLEQADWAARRQEWGQALDAYHQAAAHPRFSWEAVLLQDPSLNYKLASLLVLTGQTNEYTSFCRDAIRPDKALYLLPGHPDRELAEAGLVDAQRRLDAVPADQKSAENRHWKELTLGMAEYRAGSYSEAINRLEGACDAYNLNCAGTAAAFAAMAAQQSGLEGQAATFLGEANHALQQLMDSNAEDLGPAWHDTAILQIALREARATVSRE